MAYIYPLNNPGGVHLTVFDSTHLSPLHTTSQVFHPSRVLLKDDLPPMRVRKSEKREKKICKKIADFSPFLTKMLTNLFVSDSL